MNTSFRLLPESASTFAGQVDGLYYFLLGVTAFFTMLICCLIVFFAIRYRRGAKVDRTRVGTSMWVEAIWIVGPLPILMIIFFWGAKIFVDMYRVPADAMEISVVAKQWMWKFQHPQGRREIDELHVPAGQPVRLNMISQDVIHSLYVPAFRVKQDVLPGRYSRLWFQATKPGIYHLFCAEYCGTNHSRMRGRVVVQTPSEYETWLSGGVPSEAPEVTGARLFEQYRCDSCHRPGAGSEVQRGPVLNNLFAQRVPLTNGSTVIANDDYLRESILRPHAKIVAGYKPIMPAFEGQISEEGLTQLIAYIKSLGGKTEVPK